MGANGSDGGRGGGSRGADEDTETGTRAEESFFPPLLFFLSFPLALLVSAALIAAWDRAS